MALLIFLLGVIIAVAGYVFSNFLLQPLQENRNVKARIGYKLTYYSHIITSPSSGKLADEAMPILRDLACDLERVYLLIPLLKIISKVRIVPDPETIVDAKGQLMFL